DRGRVDADHDHAALLDEKTRGILAEGRKAQLARVARRVVPEIVLHVRPASAPVRAQQNDGSRGDAPVPRLERENVRRGQTVVAIVRGPRGDVYDDRGRD